MQKKAAARVLFAAVCALAAAARAEDAAKAFRPVEWIEIKGGTFTLGTSEFVDAAPVPDRPVAIKTFEMSKTPVTTEQYGRCVAAGACTPAATKNFACNWGKVGRERDPINCVDWSQAAAYAKFLGARLPSESEWEFAAKSGGKSKRYPWGDAEPSCERAVLYGGGDYGCGTGHTMPVCSKPAGNTEQGLCDMGGNVWQWMADKYHDSYAGTPADGSPYEGAEVLRVTRGGSYRTKSVAALRTDMRGLCDPRNQLAGFGFRVARSKP